MVIALEIHLFPFPFCPLFSFDTVLMIILTLFDVLVLSNTYFPLSQPLTHFIRLFLALGFGGLTWSLQDQT